MAFSSYLSLLKEFVPPIVFRSSKYFERFLAAQLYKKGITNKTASHCFPYDRIPYSINAKYILDIGANTGETAFAALKTYPEAKLFCVEPVKSTFAILKRKLRPYRKRIKFYNCALSYKNGKSYINITSAPGANSLEKQAACHKENNPTVRELKKEKVKTFTLDFFSQKYFPNKKIDIVKIDVEGHEPVVLENGIKFIQKYVDTILIEISLQRDESEKKQNLFKILQILNLAGFCIVNVFDLFHQENNPKKKLVQFDCVFRNTRFIE